MKNFEKYEPEIREFTGGSFCKDFIIPRILKSDNCAGIRCSECCRRQLLWVLEEYEELEVDWSKVEVDTPILVRDTEDGYWHKVHFAKYKDGEVYAWIGGTSWTTRDTYAWKYAKLAESEEERKESEVDWSKVEVDVPILVRHRLDGEWEKRHFAEYKNGDVYAWDNGRTSWTVANEIKWKYAKLAESEECNK